MNIRKTYLFISFFVLIFGGICIPACSDMEINNSEPYVVADDRGEYHFNIKEGKKDIEYVGFYIDHFGSRQGKLHSLWLITQYFEKAGITGKPFCVDIRTYKDNDPLYYQILKEVEESGFDRSGMSSEAYELTRKSACGLMVPPQDAKKALHLIGQVIDNGMVNKILSYEEYARHYTRALCRLSKELDYNAGSSIWKLPNEKRLELVRTGLAGTNIRNNLKNEWGRLETKNAEEKLQEYFAEKETPKEYKEKLLALCKTTKKEQLSGRIIDELTVMELAKEDKNGKRQITNGYIRCSQINFGRIDEYNKILESAYLVGSRIKATIIKIKAKDYIYARFPQKGWSDALEKAIGSAFWTIFPSVGIFEDVDEVLDPKVKSGEIRVDAYMNFSYSYELAEVENGEEPPSVMRKGNSKTVQYAGVVLAEVTKAGYRNLFSGNTMSANEIFAELDRIEMEKKLKEKLRKLNRSKIPQLP